VSVTVVGVPRESDPAERRVALTPQAVTSLCALGLPVVVESGAGAAAGFPDRSYGAAGAGLVRPGEAAAVADVLVAVERPATRVVERMHWGQMLIGMLAPARVPLLVRRWAEHGLSLVSLDPARRPGVAMHPMDAAAGQEAVAGHKAILLAADHLDRELGGRVQAPARVHLLGCGPATLRAADTARALGAIVTGQDPTAAGRVLLADHGVRVVDAGPWNRRRTAAALLGVDVLVTAVTPPDRPPPVLVDDAALRAMTPRGVVVDLACGPEGGNVRSARPGRARTVEAGVLVIGAGRLATTVPATASAAYSRTVQSLVAHLTPDGLLVAEPEDPVLDGLLVCRGGAVRDPRVLHALQHGLAAAGLP
jgi:NAD(P) transhydrogenase subunit alpha